MHSTTSNYALVVTVSILAVPAASAWAASPEKNVHGLSPEAASRLPGVAHLFQVRNASAPPRIAPGKKFKLGEVIARFPLEMSDEEIEQIARFSGAKEVRRIGALGLFVISGKESASGTQNLMDDLWQTGTVVDMAANYLSGSLTAVFNPDDPQYVNGNQWHIDQPSDIDLDLPEAWGEITRGSEEVVIAQTDAGLRLSHPEFSNRLFINPGEIPGNGHDDDDNGYTDDVSGWNTIDPVPNGDVSDTEAGHGTWVAGLFMANSDNAFQVAGVDHHAKILPLKMADATSTSEQQLQALMGALDYLVANPDFAQVVNMSVAGYFADPMLFNSITAAATAHILIGGSPPTGQSACTGLPNGHPDVITIGATDRNDALGLFTATGDCLDFVAPGVDVITASFIDPTSASAFHSCTGTSCATPLITGIASLCLSIHPSMSKDEFYEALKASAVDLGAPGRDNTYAWGRPTAYEALDVIRTIFADGFESGDTSRWN